VSELVESTAIEQRRLIETKEVSASELLDAHLARIDAVNPLVNAIVAFDPDLARRRARGIDEAIAAGSDPGPLAGLVTAHKDLTETADFTTTYGSPLFIGHRPAEDSLLVARMKAAGAVAVGKTNSPEFGAGSHTFNEVYGVTRNAWGLERSAGGSSGGAAVALTCRMLAIADGSDTGGSLRNPAAWGNVVGFRPTVGVVPRVRPGNAWIPISTEGPMGRTVDDVALLLAVLAAPDRRDPLYRPTDLPTRLRPPSRPVRVAWSETLGVPVEASQIDVLAGTRQAMVDLGWEVVDDEPELAWASECFRVLRAWNIANGPTAQFHNRMGEIKATIQDEIRRGTALTQAEVSVAYAQLAALWRETAAFFDRSYDVLACPVTQLSPFPVDIEFPTFVAGEQMSNYIDWMAACWRITVTGCPALSLPAGFDADGLPVGVQLVTRQGADVELLRIAKALEEATDHHSRQPPVCRDPGVDRLGIRDDGHPDRLLRR
jgi:amidase